MIERYSLPEMAAVWSEERKLELWTEIEALVLEAWAELGVVPGSAAKAIRAAPPVDASRWKARERETRHDVAAFVDVLAEAAPDAAQWVHYGLTSSDVLDTALGVMLRDATDLLLVELRALFDVVRRRALEHRATPMVGRTHGIWAEPTTFGLKLATWAFELGRAHDRLLHARRAVAVGKISGAVGTYSHVPPSVESAVLAGLDLEAEPASSQITHRDRHAEYVTTLAVVGASLERFAVELRHLQRSEVAEVAEGFGDAQKGSSAMPHKRNPISAENITGIARLLRGYAVAGLENVALWHERDISHSSVERVVLPDASLVLHFALRRMTGLVERLDVDADQMLANLAATRGLVFSQSVLLALVEAGTTRDEAYRIVQSAAATAWDEGTELQRVLGGMELPVDPGALARGFDLDHALRHTGVVFERLEALDLDSS